MRPLALYFQIHQPYRLGRYTCFDVGHSTRYFDEAENRRILERVAHRSYLPVVAMLERLIARFGKDFFITLGLSGTVLEQLAAWCPEALKAFQDLVATGNVEIVGETYHHSLAALLDADWFKDELTLHRSVIRDVFKVSPVFARNTELIYSDAVGEALHAAGYCGALIEEPSSEDSSSSIFSHPRLPFTLLARNRGLSDEVAFRFASRPQGTSITKRVSEFLGFLSSASVGDQIDTSAGDPLGLFIDSETFGEHNPKESGIFEFFERAVECFVIDHGGTCVTPSRVLRSPDALPVYTTAHPVSWADEDRGISAWLGNSMQESFARKLSQLYEQFDGGRCCSFHAKALGYLSTSDHFYYMSTKGGGDGVVHAYFSPYETPYDAFARVMNVVRDLLQLVCVVDNQRSNRL